jgi:hypothetical protein
MPEPSFLGAQQPRKNPDPNWAIQATAPAFCMQHPAMFRVLGAAVRQSKSDQTRETCTPHTSADQCRSKCVPAANLMHHSVHLPHSMQVQACTQHTLPALVSAANVLQHPWMLSRSSACLHLHALNGSDDG